MLGMDLKTIRVVGGPLVRATAAAVADAESQLWITFPKGYREYITTLGEGVLGGSFVRIYPPWRILRELAEWRERIRKHWFWDKGRKLLPKERALESVIQGDTASGDELVFHPGKPDRLFVLPRESEKIFDAGSDLLAAVEWMCDSGKLTKRFTERDFEPFDTRREKAPGRPATAEAGPADTLDAAVADLQKWAERHGLAKAAQKSFKEWLAARAEPIFGLQKKKAKKGKIKATFKDQVLVFQPEKYSQPQVVTTLTLIDSETGFHLGEYQLFAQLDGAISGGGDALMYPQAVAFAENWLGLVQE
jgi:hypothetical protein